MKKIIKLISFFVFAICLQSCEEEISLKDLGIEPKLVLYCFLSPQYDTISVSLANSQPLFSRNKTISVVEYAVVEISNDNKSWVQIPYDKACKRYLLPHSQFPVIEGTTYYIRASASGYESINASCTIPFWREVNLKPEVEFTVPSQPYVPYVDISISWQDYRGEENYYTFIGYGLQNNIGHDFINDDWFYDTTICLSSWYITAWHSTTGLILSDEGKDGEKINLLWDKHYDCTYSEFMDSYTQYDSIYVLLVQTDRNVFLYENSYQVASDMGGMESIFMIEPTLVYNNIKNGYGIFGAMTFKSYRVNFRKQTIEEAEHPKK